METLLALCTETTRDAPRNLTAATAPGRRDTAPVARCRRLAVRRGLGGGERATMDARGTP